MSNQERAIKLLRDIVEATAHLDLMDKADCRYAENVTHRMMSGVYTDKDEFYVYNTFLQEALPEELAAVLVPTDWANVPRLFRKCIEIYDKEYSASGCPCVSEQCTWPGSWYCQNTK